MQLAICVNIDTDEAKRLGLGRKYFCELSNM